MNQTERATAFAALIFDVVNIKKIISFVLLTFSFQLTAFCNEKQVVYNLITEEGSSLDQIVHETYKEFTVIDVFEDSSYKLPEVLNAEMPGSVVNEEGKEINGYVLILYLIKDDGTVAAPIVIKSTDPILTRVALDAAKGWKFESARFNRESVWSTAAQEFYFHGKN